MASIFGLKLKGRRSFMGRDWQGNQGNLYLDEKKIAWYNDSGNGGPADIDFYDISGRKENEAKLEEIVKMYYKKYPLEEQYKNLEPDVEMLIGRLIELMDDEKQYKKYAKQGYPVMIAYRKNVNGVSYFGAYKTKEFADAEIKKENLIVLQRYESLEDFDISQ